MSVLCISTGKKKKNKAKNFLFLGSHKVQSMNLAGQKYTLERQIIIVRKNRRT